MNGKIANGFVLLLLGTLVPLSHLHAERRRTVGEVAEVKGAIHVERPKKKVKLKEGLNIKEKDLVVTGEKDRLSIELKGDSALVKMAPKSAVLFQKKGSPTTDPKFRVKKGTVWFHKRAGDKVLKFSTPIAKLKSLDARFFLKVGPGDVEKLAVKEGRLEIEGDFGRIVLGPLSQATLFSGVPPIIIGVSEGDLVEWNEPFEDF